MKNMSTPLYQHVRSDSVPPRIKALAAGWQVWDFAQEGSDDTIHIDYDGDYGSERVLIVSGRATVVPDDGTPSFNVGPGDAVYFMRGFRCTWHIHETPLVQRYGYFGEGAQLGRLAGAAPGWSWAHAVWARGRIHCSGPLMARPAHHL